MLEIGNETLILTHDAIVEGVHVREDEDPADIAWKLVAVNLSDLAAKGAEPVGVLISHMLGDGDARFVEGLAEVLGTFNVPLLGGDTVCGIATRSWGCTAIGRASHIPVPDRRGARPGDAIYITGVLGRAMLGMEERGSRSEHDLAYRRPSPLVREGQALAPHVTAMMDISDGLLLDAYRMAEASRVSFAFDSAAAPVADSGRRRECLTWGDDYQLLFTALPDATLPVPATPVGRVDDKGEAPLILDEMPINTRAGLGYAHQ